jgi:hypothetical protein
MFPDLKSASLVSIGQLCDVGCQAHFSKNDLIINNANQQVVLKGNRNSNNGLWNINLSNQKPQPSANAILSLDKTKVELAQYLHAACFSPVPSTFVKAITAGHFLTWPGLTADLIRNQLPSSNAMAK